MGIVKTIIDKWDPIELLSHAPNDEYHSEIKEIEYLLSLTNDPIELSNSIYEIFVESFGKDVFRKTKSECTQIAQMILLKTGLR